MGHFMKDKQCVACNQSFKPRPQTPNQSYCSKPSCQKKRKRQWQRNKLKTDPSYKENQSNSQQAWIGRNPDYWRNYRESHPDYVTHNRTMQQKRNAKTRVKKIANMDVSNPITFLPSGTYQLTLITDDKVAKVDVWTVEITVYSCNCVPVAKIAKR